MPHTAILIAEKGWIPAGVAGAWLRAGNGIAEVWCFAADSPLLRPPRGLIGRLFPRWDVVRLLARHRVPVRLCPPLKGWHEAAARADAVQADVLMTLMTHQIVPAPLLRHFGGRAVNLHPALLPDYKGPSPRIGMLLDGQADLAGGVTLHVLSPGIDEGPVIASRPVPRSQARSYHHWEALQAVAAGELAGGPLLDYLAGRLAATPQVPGSGSYRRPTRAELAIGPAVDAARARFLCETLGDTGGLHCVGAGGTIVSLGGFSRHLGLPTGLPPRVGLREVELDVKDARLRLRRRTPLSKALVWARKVEALRSVSARGTA
ncbi:formyltransferase family protein [Aquibium microcysteis]|uniref:formyltransferase family protein n=1 Tax=Aquibium microcysteis TaxID=675281 RepID=UPI00165D04D8|nr:formyltransferase family protein [Aquibium microcysteis]